MTDDSSRSIDTTLDTVLETGKKLLQLASMLSGIKKELSASHLLFMEKCVIIDEMQKQLLSTRNNLGRIIESRSPITFRPIEILIELISRALISEKKLLAQGTAAEAKVKQEIKRTITVIQNLQRAIEKLQTIPPSSGEEEELAREREAAEAAFKQLQEERESVESIKGLKGQTNAILIVLQRQLNIALRIKEKSKRLTSFTSKKEYAESIDSVLIELQSIGPFIKSEQNVYRLEDKKLDKMVTLLSKASQKS